MDTAVQHMTREGYEQKQRELEAKRADRARVIEALKDARAQGDLSENADYDAAKEEQERIDNEISVLEQTLATAKIVDVVDTSYVSIGSVVTIEDERGKELMFKIVGSTEIDVLNHQISNESPAGAAMIGHSVGDVVSFTTPRGKVCEYTIKNISVG